MKKVLIIAILISYTIACLGVTLNYFYCCGKLKTVSLTVNSEEKNSKAKSTKGCCENKTVTVKLKADQKEGDQQSYHFSPPPSIPILHTENYTAADLAVTGKQNPLYKRPPPGILPSLQVLYCVFRI